MKKWTNEMENALWDYADGTLLGSQSEETARLVSTDLNVQTRLKEIQALKASFGKMPLEEPEVDFTLKVLDAWQKESGIPMLEPVRNKGWIIKGIVIFFSMSLLLSLALLVFYGTRGTTAGYPINPYENQFLTSLQQMVRFTTSKLFGRGLFIAEILVILGVADTLLRKLRLARAH